jgi:hypothetical protein
MFNEVQLGEILDTGVVVMLLHLRNYLVAIKVYPGRVLLLMNLQLVLIILQQTGISLSLLLTYVMY